METLKVEGVSSGYGRLQVLADVSLSADRGVVTVVVGPNGSGKSTLLKTIAGLTTLYAGKVTLGGEQVSGLPPHKVAKAGISYLPQTESVFANLTVAENIRMAAYSVPTDATEERKMAALGKFPQIEGYMGTKAQNLSGGERQMVAMAMALMRQPVVMMFDEPTANLSPKLAGQVLAMVGGLAKDLNIAVLLVEQNARRALEIGDRAYLLVGGKVVFDGGAKVLLAHKELAQMYLGLKPA